MRINGDKFNEHHRKNIKRLLMMQEDTRSHSNKIKIKHIVEVLKSLLDVFLLAVDTTYVKYRVKATIDSISYKFIE